MTFKVKDGTGGFVDLVSRTEAGEEVVKYDTVPLATPDLTWVVDQTMAADKNYDSVDCQRFSTVFLEFIMAATAEGVLFIEWSMDDSTFYPFAFDPDKFSLVDESPSVLTPDEAAGSVTVATTSQETRFALGIEKPPPFMRGRWDFTAGSATGMDAKNFGRG